MRTIKLVSSLSILIIACALLFSPYKRHDNITNPMLKVSTIIPAKSNQVFAYLGASKNVSKWSVFIDHITPLKGIDGKIGSIRRCFKDASENGVRWDEETVVVESNKRRRLTVYNLRAIPIEAKGLLTEQLYEQLPGGNCKLTFTLFFDEGQDSIWQVFKMSLCSYYIDYIFQQNLTNISHQLSTNV